MNILQKLANARADLKKREITKSGKNTFADYDYFELADVLPHITELELQYGMLSVVQFGDDMATLTLYNADKPEEFITFTSPMSTATLKGCHPVQNLGAAETYIRRYLYITAYEIVERDALDKTQGKPSTQPQGTQRQQPQGSAGNAPLTLERAEKLAFKSGNYKGKPFKELGDKQLEWVAENGKGIYKEGAALILESRKQAAFPNAAIVDDEDLPWN